MSWDYLKKGDIIDLIAPGYGIKPKEVQPCLDYIKSLGLTPRIPDDLLGDDLFSSNTDDIRFEHLRNALYAKDSKAVWCIKGGYGTGNLLPELAKLKRPEKQKLVIGFSDITALHLFLNQNWGWSSIHGSVVWQLIKNRVCDESKNRINSLIFGGNQQQEFILKKLNNTEENEIKGRIIGGNLMLIQSSMSTPWEINTENNIIFIEDIDEKSYRVDRILNHLLHSNLIQKANAVIFGDFVCDGIKDQAQNIEKVQHNFAEKINIPVFKTASIGHGDSNFPLPMGTSSTIDCRHTKLVCNNK